MPMKTLSQSLPQRAYSATQVLENEATVAKEKGISLPQLMEKAGQTCFTYIQEESQNITQMLVLCGKGNNGGDGFVIARLAQQYGINVTVYLCVESEALSGDAKRAFDKLQDSHVTIIYQSEMILDDEFFKENQYEVIVDALFGIGFKGNLPESYHPLISAVNRCRSTVISVDVPSGLNATTGEVSTLAIQADFTITFIVFKQGMLTGKAANYVGTLLLADLSLGTLFQEKIESKVEIQGQLTIPDKPTRSENANKGEVGLLLTVGGNTGMPGAIRLASESSLRTGASLVSVCTHESNHLILLNGRPELMLAPSNYEKLINSAFYEKAKVLLCGPGLGKDAWAKELFKMIPQLNKPCLLDADALRLLAEKPIFNDNWVLSPHPGEAAKLLGISIAEVEKDRLEAVKNIALKYGGICILKGAGSLISDGQFVWINTSGNSGMASGGMGDVLSGIIAALMMQLPTNFDAARLGVYLHGVAADIVAEKKGKIGMLASDLFPEIQQLIN